MLAVLAVLALALPLRLWLLRSLHVDGLHGQAAYAYYYHDVALRRDHTLSHPWPWLPHPMRLYWPLGMPALVAMTAAGYPLLAMAAVGHPSVAMTQGPGLPQEAACRRLAAHLRLRPVAYVGVYTIRER